MFSTIWGVMETQLVSTTALLQSDCNMFLKGRWFPTHFFLTKGAPIFKSDLNCATNICNKLGAERPLGKMTINLSIYFLSVSFFMVACEQNWSWTSQPNTLHWQVVCLLGIYYARQVAVTHNKHQGVQNNISERAMHWKLKQCIKVCSWAHRPLSSVAGLSKAALINRPVAKYYFISASTAVEDSRMPSLPFVDAAMDMSVAGMLFWFVPWSDFYTVCVRKVCDAGKGMHFAPSTRRGSVTSAVINVILRGRQGQ